MYDAELHDLPDTDPESVPEITRADYRRLESYARLHEDIDLLDLIHSARHGDTESIFELARVLRDELP